MEKYFYEGPVKLFEKIIIEHVEDYTVAATKNRARANLEFRYKQRLGYTRGAKINLPGKLTIVNVKKGREI